MAKSLFLMILAGILGIVNSNVFLAAANENQLVESEDSAFSDSLTFEEPVNIDDNLKTDSSKSEAKNDEVADVVRPAVDSSEEEVTESVANTATKKTEDVSTSKPVVSKPVSKPTAKPAAPANSITIAGNTIEIVNVSSIDDSGNHVNRFQKLLYGHNYSSIFGGISSLGVGSTFVIRVNGRETTYKVGSKIYYDKDNSTKAGALRRPGSSQNYMNSIARGYDYDAGRSYDVAIMTCAGKSLGGGDATKRLVLFANAI